MCKNNFCDITLLSYFLLQNDMSQERMTLAQLLVDLLENKKQNQKLLIQNLEAQNIETVIIKSYLF